MGNRGVDALKITWSELGAKLATSSDEEQAAFFHGFLHEFVAYETHFARECHLS